jgi:peptide-methionine (S)-S-oxide reductase
MLQGYFKLLLLGYFSVVGTVVAEEAAIKKQSIAIFAGGCFWCMEPPFDALPGVIGTTSGYTGGHAVNPTYKDVSNGKTGHLEAVQVAYDPTIISYEKLLEVFWHNIDPYDDDGQFCDKGDQYRAAIFYQDENEKQLAEASKAAVKTTITDQAIVTTIRPASQFYPAEDYHQNYYLNNPNSYKFYRFSCGRDRRLSDVWDE